MRKIRFIHQCHIEGRKYVEGTIVNESDLPAKWLKGALALGYVEVVKDEPAADQKPPNNTGDKSPPSPPSDEPEHQ